MGDNQNFIQMKKMSGLCELQAQILWGEVYVQGCNFRAQF